MTITKFHWFGIFVAVIGTVLLVACFSAEVDVYRIVVWSIPGLLITIGIFVRTVLNSQDPRLMHRTKDGFSTTGSVLVDWLTGTGRFALYSRFRRWLRGESSDKDNAVKSIYEEGRTGHQETDE
jgi:hypothetical protein